MYDRDPDECDTSEFHVFLKRLDSTGPNSARPNRSFSLRIGDGKLTSAGTDSVGTNGHNQSIKYIDTTPTNSKSPRTPPTTRPERNSLSPTSAVIRSSRHPSGEQPKFVDSPRISGMPRSNSSLPVDQFHQQHHFPHQPFTTTTVNAQLDAFRGKTDFAHPDHGRSRPEVVTPVEAKSTTTDPTGRGYRALPCTERCEKQLCEIVTTKATSEEYGYLTTGPYSRSGSEVSRSSSIHSFASSSTSAQPGTTNNGSLPSLVIAQQRTATNSMASATGRLPRPGVADYGSRASNSSSPYVTESSLSGESNAGCVAVGSDPITPKPGRTAPTARWTGNSMTNSTNQSYTAQASGGSKKMNSMESVYGRGFSRDSPRGVVVTRREPDDSESKPTLEVVGRPRVLLEYGDL
ncbi:unnamed protein product [Echinostoma caproni]|uniref:Uncharacterized protein n=1 Tax=Echinostoma caproni TaxID=27848 RepID=A0A183AZ98_9TREM|nr:unnamed protein product [Echinostoma caproni]